VKSNLIMSTIAVLSIAFFAETLFVQNMREDLQALKVQNLVKSYKIIEERELKLKREPKEQNVHLLRENNG